MQGHRGVVVVVEDDHSLNRAIRRLLKAAGFRALTFESAEALLVDAAARRADCFVFDIHLPGASGLELFRKMRDDGVLSPVIIITAHDDPQYRNAAAQMGAAAYLTKPFSTSSLIDAISRVVAARLGAS